MLTWLKEFKYVVRPLMLVAAAKPRHIGEQHFLQQIRPLYEEHGDPGRGEAQTLLPGAHRQVLSRNNRVLMLYGRYYRYLENHLAFLVNWH